MRHEAQSESVLFVDEVHNDFHIQAASPAKDLVDNGPDHDIEGNLRPCGTRFDIGAYELCP